MVWSKPSLSSRFSNHPPTQAASTGSQHPLSYANQGRVGRNNYVPQISRPGNRACLAFNRGLCQTQAAHPSDLHVCAYCLQVAQKLCRHPETRCNPKQKQKTGKGGYKITCLPLSSLWISVTWTFLHPLQVSLLHFALLHLL